MGLNDFKHLNPISLHNESLKEDLDVFEAVIIVLLLPDNEYMRIKLKTIY